MQPDVGALDYTLKAAQQGEVAAFNTLVQAYQRQVFNVCYRMLGNAEDAADATQDALLNAFRAVQSFNGPPTGLRGWLLRIAANTCYDQLRRRQRKPSESLDALHATDTDPEPSLAERLKDPRPGPRTAEPRSRDGPPHPASDRPAAIRTAPDGGAVRCPGP